MSSNTCNFATERTRRHKKCHGGADSVYIKQKEKEERNT